MDVQRDPVIEKAAEAVGGIVALSHALGRSRGAVSQWIKIPAEHVLAIESLTGISRHEQRPDIFGPPPKAPSTSVAQEAAP